MLLLLQQFADSIGLPTDEGLFGFKPFPEVRMLLVWCRSTLSSDILAARSRCLPSACSHEHGAGLSLPPVAQQS